MSKSHCHALLTVGLTLLVAGYTTAAHAQKVRRPFAIKLGVHIPSDRVTRREVGQVWFFGGISYDIARSYPRSNLYYQLYMDYAHRESFDTSGADGAAFSGNGTLWGGGPAAKLLLAPVTAPSQPYVGIGGGFYQVKGPAYNTVYGFTGDPLGRGISGTRTATRFGGKIFAGYQTGSGFFWEVDYTYVGEIDGLMPGGTGARLGFRF